MAIKKTELYRSLWASCDELRGGMDASQYKDYVLTMLFVKYISDKAQSDQDFAIEIPDGASFQDMVNLIGNTEIGDKINKQILNPIKEANGLNDFPDFNDESKLGKGKDLVETVSNLVRIFNDNSLDFSKNSAEGDDILGDAYEYLMRHFATESGKSKGQFYTPAEVSRILAKVIGITPRNSSRQTTAYDPTCGSGSLLLKVMNEAGKEIDLYGQEKETTTSNLANMNMILHGAETRTIVADNTLTRPAYKEADGSLKRFDYVIANPPFSLKSWSNGVNIESDEFERFTLGVPPEKNGDYAFLLHILQSMKAKGKAAVVLPHGVLFRGNAEGEIRKNILKKGYIKGIIGLPANLFYGTGIPACIIVLDKENAEHRKGIFMMDASKGFLKDGNKNRLREQDLRKITDVFTQMQEVPKYSRMVSITEIADEKNDYNLNIPRYIDTQESEDIQDLLAHLQGGIPLRDLEAMQTYWNAYPKLKHDLFSPLREGYVKLNAATADIKTTIFNHPEFKAFNETLNQTFNAWLDQQFEIWDTLEEHCNGKDLIAQMSESLLKAFENNTLVEGYDLYQHAMSYWQETMQDDVYSISLDGWKAGNEWERSIIKGKKGKDGKPGKDKEVAGLAGVEGRMISPELLSQVYFAAFLEKIETAQQSVENSQATMAEIEEEHTSTGSAQGEEGLFADLEKVNASEVSKLLKIKQKEELRMVAEPSISYGNNTPKTEVEILETYLAEAESIKKANAKIKILQTDLEKEVIAKYAKLTEAELKDLVLNHKWKAHLISTLHQEQDEISQGLTQRINALAERYATTLANSQTELASAETKVTAHLEKMGLVW
ncbi:type I restriction-modification system subunit M [Frigoriflavimonas asaccharolytica]|uniref:site-specific DNA-methyltransferase (adenine-specific) n=1 Tax=Frigoriflavimonas asaccharolytica TaxID=2735899 RepID=A0A8J8K6B9_9FLAO|nr:type I restriction-modification system subunit M [Frigoriflavimonas asaccharolytica]NRS93570.1 type I restriction enzyme M protein [Frigoriflavimonas asaccharolytica]